MNIPLIVFISVLLITAIILSIAVLISDNHLFGTGGSARYKKGLDNNTKLLLSIATTLILFSFLSPLIFSEMKNYSEIDYDKSGVIGDTIGGLMNPFIAMSAVIVTGLAFYAQYRANEQIREQFNLQKFESQFYEMLRIHNQNVENLTLTGVSYLRESSEGSTAFLNVPDKIQYGKREVIEKCVQEINSTIDIVEKIKKIHNIYLSNVHTVHLVYIITFEGIDYISLNVERLPNDNAEWGINSDDLNLIVTELKEVKRLNKAYDNKYHCLPIRVNYELFEGRHNVLGNYFRHLYLTVKTVVDTYDALLTYEEKRHYLRIMRAQLSVYEQVLLYYNWLGKYGENWESRTDRENKSGNRFFTDYRMIHNLNDEFVHSIAKASDVFIADYRMFKYEKGRKDKDTLFAIMGLVSKID